MFQRDRHALFRTVQHRRPESYAASPVRVGHLAKEVLRQDCHADLLLTFPDERIPFGLAWFDLSARELPEPGQFGRPTALGGKNFARMDDGRRDDRSSNGDLAGHSARMPQREEASPGRHNAVVRVSARVDYAIRASLELAARAPAPLTSERIAAAQKIPVRFLQSILADLTAARLVASQRGRDGGYRLSRPATDISIADVMRVEQGFLADVHGQRPEDLDYPGVAHDLANVWVAARAAYRGVLERVTLADILAGHLPPEVAALLSEQDAWVSGLDRS